MDFTGSQFKTIKFSEYIGTASQIATSLTTLDQKIADLKAAVSGGVIYKDTCTITEGVLSITAPQTKGWMYLISSGSITVDGIDYTVGDYVIVKEDVAAGGSLDGKLVFINSQDTDVAKLGKNNVFTVTPQSTGSVSADTDLTTKQYVDAKVATASNSHYEGVRQTDESDSAAIARILDGATPKGGDSLVIKTLLATGKYSYTAFIFDDSADVWKACDGNYDADNVYLTSDITLAGNYTSVGNISKGSTTATKTYSATGKSIKEVLTEMLSQDTQPTITANPSVSLTFKNGSTTISADTLIEVGTTIVPTWNASLSAGSYTAFSGQVATGVTASAWDVRLRKGGTDVSGKTSTKNADNFGDIVLDDGDVYTIYASATHGAGAQAKTALGNLSNPAVAIAAGSKNATSKKITAYRKSFYGTLTTAASSSLTSAQIRALASSSSSALAAGSVFDISLPIGAKSVVFAYPATIRDVNSVKDVNGMNAEIKGSFTQFTVNVASASGEDAISYKVYYMNFADALTKANTYKVTL